MAGMPGSRGPVRFLSGCVCGGGACGFRRYWTLGVGSGAHVLVHGLLEVGREDAEADREAASLPA